MTQMKLNSLEISNFKGVRKFSMEPNGADVRISGDNGTGKTTVTADAIQWLLFGKDSRGQASFSIWPNGAEGDAKRPLKCSVSATFDVDGKEIALSRSLVEKWTKKTGVKTGTTTEYSIDDVPMQEGEYKARIAEIAGDEKIFRLLTSIGYFNEVLSMKDRREMLFALTSITDDDVISNNDDLAHVPDILGGKEFDDRLKSLKGSLKKVEKKRDEIPARIDEVLESMPDPPEESRTDLEVDLQDRESAIESMRQQVADLKAGGGAAKIRDQIAKIEAEERAETQAAERSREKQIAHLRKNMEAEQEISLSGSRDIARHDQEKARIELEISSLRRINKELLDKFHAVAPAPVDETCPTCSQTIPEEQLAEIKRSANQRAAEEKKRIVAEGQANDAKIRSLLDTIEIKDKSAKTVRDGIALADKAASGIAAKIMKIQANPIIVTEPSSVLVELRTELAKIESGEQDTAAEIAKTLDMIEIAKTNARCLSDKIGMYKTIDKATARVDELKADDVDLAGQSEEIARDIAILEEFTRAKCAAVESSINSQFDLVEWRLFETLINGGIKDVCTAVYRPTGADWGTMSNGERVRAGLDIVLAFSRHHGFSPLVVVDNHESVTEIPDMGCQVIGTFVEKGKKLTVG